MTDRERHYPYGIRKILKEKGKIHIVGIGGSMMRGIAALLRDEGYPVCGSDASERAAEEVSALGIPVFPRHAAENLAPDTVLLIYTSAVSQDNPELRRARELGIPAVSRAEFLGAYMTGYARRVGVSGTHGKSTTTALLDFVAAGAGEKPTTLLGAELPGLGSSVRRGEKDLFVYEACEYRDSFLDFFPTEAVFLNMEWDHTDYFRTPGQMEESFLLAMARAQRRVILNADDPGLMRLREKLTVPAFTFGRAPEADLAITEEKTEDGRVSFLPVLRGHPLERVTCGEIGENAPRHAAAALSVACLYGWDLSAAALRIASFPGISRRLEVLRRGRNGTFYYDYAHHPSEISSVLGTLRRAGGTPLTAVFRPHTYTRTRDLLPGFSQALRLADRVVVTDVFPARELPIPGIDGAALARAVGEKAVYVPLTDLAGEVLRLSGTVVLLGAGDFGDLPEKIRNMP